MKKRLPAAPLAALRLPAAATAPAAAAGLHHSPRLVAQRQRLQAAFGTAFAPPAAASLPVQRKIVLAGEQPLRDTNLADLNRMLAGIRAEVAARPSGEVYFAIRPRKLKGTEHEGFRLLQSLVDHRHTVTLGYSSDKDDAKVRTAARPGRPGAWTWTRCRASPRRAATCSPARGGRRRKRSRADGVPRPAPPLRPAPAGRLRPPPPLARPAPTAAATA